jgi:hypothetical protein
MDAVISQAIESINRMTKEQMRGRSGESRCNGTPWMFVETC